MYTIYRDILEPIGRVVNNSRSTFEKTKTDRNRGQCQVTCLKTRIQWQLARCLPKS